MKPLIDSGHGPCDFSKLSFDLGLTLASRAKQTLVQAFYRLSESGYNHGLTQYSMSFDSVLFQLQPLCFCQAKVFEMLGVIDDDVHRFIGVVMIQVRCIIRV